MQEERRDWLLPTGTAASRSLSLSVSHLPHFFWPQDLCTLLLFGTLVPPYSTFLPPLFDAVTLEQRLEGSEGTTYPCLASLGNRMLLEGKKGPRRVVV